MSIPIAAANPGTRHRTLPPFTPTFGGAVLPGLCHHALHHNGNDATLAHKGLDRVPFRTSMPARAT